MKRIKKRSLQEKCRKIKLILTDVDGVLTDGGRYYTEKGEEQKKFHARDGMGVNILRRNGIKTAIITKENSKITKRWAKEMNIAKVYTNAIRKEQLLEKIRQDFRVLNNEIVFIGDDVNDVELLRKVGFSAVPRDGVALTKKIVDYVCELKGGQGAFRELVDLILSKKLSTKTKWY